MNRREKTVNRFKKHVGGIVIILATVNLSIGCDADNDAVDDYEAEEEHVSVAVIEDEDYDDLEDEYVPEEVEEDVAEEELEEVADILTFGSTFMHEDFEIEIGNAEDIIWRSVD